MDKPNTNKQRKLTGIDVQAAIDNIQHEIDQDTKLSSGLKSAIQLLIVIIKLLSDRWGLNSTNSSKPPSSDPHRMKPTRQPTNRKVGGQPGHEGKTLTLVDNPDEVLPVSIDRSTLPKGRYFEAEAEVRQVFDIRIARHVTEYRAQVLVDEDGRRFTATFPDHVTSPVQYGVGLKAHAVYLSQFQLLPYERIRTYFSDQAGIPLSAGSLVRFNQQAARQLADLQITEQIKQALRSASVVNVDETSLNIAGQRHWLHVAANTQWTDYHVHPRRGFEAMEEADVIPHVRGTLCHDHWKSYYRYWLCVHALCNAHHQRELERAWEQDKYQWAKDLKAWLIALKNETDIHQGVLPEARQAACSIDYRAILDRADIECPAPVDDRPKNKRKGKLKRSKSRNLIERLRRYENDVLRFMTATDIPYTNNLGEQDLRMMKVQQKISGCFRSLAGAEAFCAIRGFLSTCRKQGVSPSDGISLILRGEKPDFLKLG